MNSNQNIGSKRFIVLGFILLLIIPNVLMLTDLEDQSEFSMLTKYPEIDIENPRGNVTKLKKYYLTHFGLKPTLVNTYLDFKTNTLNENPIQNRVVKGIDDWYFLGNEHNRVLDNTFGIHKYSDIDLFVMKQNLLEFNDYIKSLNIELYFVIVPNKNTVYQEKLPYKVNQRDTPITQFLSTIDDSDDLNILDLRPVLLNSKNESTLLYHKTDTHWNDIGAHLGYEYVITSISKNINNLNVVPLSEFKSIDTVRQGDITRMINIYDKESITSYTKPNNSVVINEKNTYQYKKFKNSNKNSKLLMFRDSFAINWFDYFNESFGETLYLRYTNISKSQITEEQPDIVILEVAERNFDILLKEMKLSQ
ncbi:alginate O-acetyltransferase AlgX-related protein [Psychroserpens ponticola]|uniref:AlgX/AlgJ SGNH hydrolase-like domain-containing protein n=1 Tax=Psychroserpens ponticola TaxID=2932268 RepID=A0ABY7RWH5_9FLAO|nr:hypothetical protein [Psychroserpens ponticola]WCO01499.1 hypothetical protein MUN68_015715 [Psychroserpens ponticola]